MPVSFPQTGGCCLHILPHYQKHIETQTSPKGTRTVL